MRESFLPDKTDKVIVFIGNIIHCPEKLKVECIENGILVVQGKKIINIDGPTNHETILNILRSQYEHVEIINLSDSQILIPGLIDTHIHASQYPNCGLGYDMTLLDWLANYTFKLEKIFKDLSPSVAIYDAVVKKTIAHGTTTACYFATLYTDSSIALADTMLAHHQRGFVGKVNMTKCIDADYLEGKDELVTNTERFIEAVLSKNTDLIKPIITPRFAISVDTDDMLKLSELANKYDLNIQTHISENKCEIKIVEEEFHTSYANAYNNGGLLNNKTILAHAIYLNDDELKLIKNKQSSISHCPESNTCLKSGLCDVKKFLDYGITVGLGSDISGGSSPSIRQAMKSALDVSVHLSFIKDNYKPLTYCDVFYMATLGGAEALNLEKKIGNFIIGKEFDALIIDVNIQESQIDHLIDCSPMEILQKFIYSGDDRNVVEVYIAGKCVKTNKKN